MSNSSQMHPTRPLAVDDENKLWRFIHEYTYVQKHYKNVYVLLYEYLQFGYLEEYPSSDVYQHFFNVMLRRMYATDALTPTQILQLYQQFRLPISPFVAKVLSLRSSAKLKIDSRSVLVSWTPNEQTPPRSNNPLRSTFRLPWSVEVGMWKHIKENIQGLSGSTIKSLDFWEKMKVADTEITATVLLKYFLSRVRHILFALDIETTAKLELMQSLNLEMRKEHLNWLFTVNDMIVDTYIDGGTQKWINWREAMKTETADGYPEFIPNRGVGEKKKVLKKAHKSEMSKKRPVKVEKDRPKPTRRSTRPTVAKVKIESPEVMPQEPISPDKTEISEEKASTICQRRVLLEWPSSTEDLALVVSLNTPSRVEKPKKTVKLRPTSSQRQTREVVFPAESKFITFQKDLVDDRDILKLVNQFHKPPISFHHDGISFIRDRHTVQIRLADKSKETVVQEMEREVAQSTKTLSMFKKRRARSPISPQPSAKRVRKLSARPFSSDVFTDLNYESMLFHTNRGIFPVVGNLAIPN